MARPENEFPTIRDLRDRLSELIERDLGDLPIQIVVVPDSTMQAIARSGGEGVSSRPALMIEFPCEGPRLGVPFISTERLDGGRGMPSTETQ